MTSLAGGIAFVLLFVAGLAAQGGRELVGITSQARVVSVIDGDTVDVILAGERRPVRLRLDGVDTPEQGEPFNDAARRFTRTLLFDQAVFVDGKDVDSYGRLVARVRVGKTDSSLELVTAGLACHFRRYSQDLSLAQAEVRAKAAGRGFWAPQAQRPRCVAANSAAPAATPRPAAPKQPARGQVLHGNTTSHVYHASFCPNYNCKNCSQLFASESAAKAAGYRPAGDCLGRK